MLLYLILLKFFGLNRTHHYSITNLCNSGMIVTFESSVKCKIKNPPVHSQYECGIHVPVSCATIVQYKQGEVIFQNKSESLNIKRDSCFFYSNQNNIKFQICRFSFFDYSYLAAYIPSKKDTLEIVFENNQLRFVEGILESINVSTDTNLMKK